MSDKNFPASSSDSSKPILQATSLKGDPGNPGRLLMIDPPFIAIPCDSDDSNPVFTNASCTCRIMDGSEIIANAGDADGWTLEVYNSSNVTGSIASFGFTVNGITADTGWVIFRAYKSGEIDLFGSVYVKRINKGVKGDTGDTGSTGSQGPTGPQGDAGNDGTGLVVLKYNVSVKSHFTGVVTFSDNGGNLRITFGTDPGLVVGERIHVYDGAFNYDDICTVTVDNGSGVYDTDLTYGGVPNSGPYVWSMRNFRQSDDSRWTPESYQNLEFPNILPIGAKIDEVAFAYVNQENSGYLWIDIGNYAYPAAGYTAYFGSRPLSTDPQVVQEQINHDHSAYQANMILLDNYRRDIYVRGRVHNYTMYWNTVFGNDDWQLFISYKNFGLTLP